MNICYHCSSVAIFRVTLAVAAHPSIDKFLVHLVQLWLYAFIVKLLYFIRHSQVYNSFLEHFLVRFFEFDISYFGVIKNLANGCLRMVASHNNFPRI